MKSLAITWNHSTDLTRMCFRWQTRINWNVSEWNSVLRWIIMSSSGISKMDGAVCWAKHTESWVIHLTVLHVWSLEVFPTIVWVCKFWYTEVTQMSSGYRNVTGWRVSETVWALRGSDVIFLEVSSTTVYTASLVVFWKERKISKYFNLRFNDTSV